MHYCISCSKCGKVIEQCRCPSKDKEQRYEVCDDCKDSVPLYPNGKEPAC
jgi:hypothetical protein